MRLTSGRSVFQPKTTKFIGRWCCWQWLSGLYLLVFESRPKFISWTTTRVIRFARAKINNHLNHIFEFHQRRKNSPYTVKHNANAHTHQHREKGRRSQFTMCDCVRWLFLWLDEYESSTSGARFKCSFVYQRWLHIAMSTLQNGHKQMRSLLHIRHNQMRLWRNHHKQTRTRETLFRFGIYGTATQATVLTECIHFILRCISSKFTQHCIVLDCGLRTVNRQLPHSHSFCHTQVSVQSA